MMPRALSPAVLGLVLLLSACASGGLEPLGPDAKREHPAWLTGTWQGTGYQVNASKTQGEGTISITFAPDGGWKATTAAGVSSGTSWVVRDRVVLEGVTPDGAQIRYTLKERDGSGGREIWGIVEASFGAAMVTLKRVS